MTERIGQWLLRPLDKVGEGKDRHMILRAQVIVLFSLVGAMVLLFYTGYNMVMGKTILWIGELTVALWVLANVLLFYRHRNVQAASMTVMLALLALSVLLVHQGGIGNTGIYWLFLNPVLAFFLTGKRVGLIWMGILAAVMVVLVLGQWLGVWQTAYTLVELRQGTAAVTVVSVMVYLYERVVHDFRVEVEERESSMAKRVETSLAQLREKDNALLLQSRHAAMGEMISNIAHQWRQPLNAAGLVFQKIRIYHKKGMLDDKAVEENVEKGVALVKKMSTTIDDFRDFFKPEQEKHRFDVCDVARHSLALLEGAFANKGVQVTFSCQGDPEGWGFAGQFSQALLNLVNNGKVAIEERGVIGGKIHVEVIREPEGTLVVVEDNGGGINGKIVDKIFDPYFTTREEGKGTGLGLFMTRKIVEENLDGSIWVENALSPETGEVVGARFEIMLPPVPGEDR